MRLSPKKRSTAPHPVDEVLPAGRSLAYGVQHVAAMYAGVIAPPLIIGQAAGLDPARMTLLLAASLLTAGLATILQSVGIGPVGARLPFVNGVTFAAVAPVLAILAAPGGGLGVVYGSVLAAGLLAVLAAPVFSRLVRFFPPLVNGSVITLIGISLLPVAVRWIVGQDSAPNHGSPERLGLGALALALVLLLNRFARGFAHRVALLIALLAGTLLAWPLGLVDTSTFDHAPAFALPVPFQLATPEFSAPAVLSLCVVMLVAMTESTADMIALGEVVGRPVTERTLTAGLRADGAGSALSAVFGGFTCSAFAQNIGLVALTRVRSRFVVATGGGVLVLLGLFPVVGATVSLVPKPVLGGAALVLFGSVAASGIRTLGQCDLSETGNALVVAGSLGTGLIPVVSPDFSAHLPAAVRTVLDSGISAGCLTAIALNLLFHGVRARKSTSESAST